MEVLMIVGIILAIALIVLVLIQPRQSQLFSMDATSNIGKPGYWQNKRLVKMVTLLISLALFVLLLVFMLVTYQQRTSEEFSEVLCGLVSIFLVKIDLNLDKGFSFA